MLKYKIGAIGSLDMDLHPSTRGTIAFDNLLKGLTYELMKQIRIELLNTTQNDFSKYAEAFKVALDQGYIAALVSNKGLEESKELYENIRDLKK